MANCWVVVTDSALARIYDADPKTREVSEIAALIHTEGRDHERDLSSDRGGRSFDSVGGGRHTMSKHISPHEHEADLFARRIAERLGNGYEAGEFTRLCLSAPPAFLGLLRKHLDSKVRNILDQTISKNLIHETPESIASQFFGASKRSNAPLDR